MIKYVSAIIRSTLKHPGLIILSVLSAALLVLALHNTMVISLSNSLNLLTKDTVFRRLCPPPQFSPIRLQATGLASFPGSGNTWLRYMVQEATGILTGSEYNDTQLFQKGFPAEGNTSPFTVMVKTHGSDHPTRRRYSRVILLIRHPKEAIVSEFNLFLSGGHFDVATEEAYKQYWISFLESHTKAWYKFHKDWLNYRKPMLIVRYEDMLSQPEKELSRIAEFLQVPIISRGLSCGMYTSKRFIRSKSKPPMQLYTKNMADNLDKLYKNIILALNKY